MNRKITGVAHIQIVFALILALVFCTAAQADTYEANTMRLLHYQGSVEIFDASGESRFVMENVRFSSGEVLQTGEDSLASVSLDDSKIVTLDANSRVEFIQEASHFRLNLLQGAIILDVQAKLDENESLDIQTSTMVVGIRGTLVFMSEEPTENAQEVRTKLGILEGTAQIDYEDQSGAHRLMPVQAGRVVTIESQAKAGTGVSPVITEITSQDVAGFVSNRVLDDAVLTRRVIEGSEAGATILQPMNPSEIGEESAFDFPAEGDWTWNDTVTLVAQSASKMYDGSPLTRPSDVLVYGLPQGVNIRVSAIGSQIDAGEGINSIDQYTIYNSNGEDVTRHFTNVEKISGKLTVDPAPLTVWTGSAEKYYDGEPLTNPETELRTVPGYEADEPTWRNTSFVTRTALGSETMIAVTGSTWVHSTNPISGATREIMLFAGQRLSVQLSNEKDDGSIDFQIETLTVDELPEDILRLYADNPDLMDQACKDAGWDPLLLTERIAELQESNEKTIVKNGLNVAVSASEDLMRDSTDVRITIDTEITNYRSQPLTGNEAHFTPIAIDPSIVVTATGNQTEVGESPNTYTIDWGSARASNYTLNEDLGTLTVLPLREGTVTITADSVSKVYDGMALEANSFTVNGLPGGFTVSATAQGRQTDAGSVKNQIVSYTILDENGEDATGQFANILVVSGVLTVTPAPLTITTGSASREYDGSALTSGEVSVTGLQGDDMVTVTATGSQTGVGSSENTYIIDWGSTNSGNYTLSESLGTLEITASSAGITLTAGSASKVYDGAALTSDEVTVSGLPTGHTVSAVLTGSVTDAGTVENGIGSYTIQDANGNDVTSDFANITIITGTLEVTPAPLTITTGSASREYDGSALTSEEVSVTGLQGDDMVTVTATGSQTGVGSSENTYTIDWGSTNSGNYTLSESLGTLEITASSAGITLTAGSASKVYDGAALTSDEVTVSGLPTGHTVSAILTGSVTDAGTGENGIGSYTIQDADGNDVTSSFANITTVTGTLEVTPAGLTVTTGSASREYDGSALTNGEVSVTGLQGDDMATVTATGSQTGVGSSENTYTIDWGSTNSGNYILSESLGTLEITASSAGITLTAGSASKVYDGTALTSDEVTVSGLPEGHTISAVLTGSVTDAGTGENGIGSYTIQDADGNDVTSNFANITTVTGTLEVTPAGLTVTTGSASREYDGSALTNGEVSVTGLQGDDMVTVTATGSQTGVGSSENTYTIDWGSTNSGNYILSESLGTLTVTENNTSIVFTADSASKTFDGTPLTAEDVTVSGLPTGFNASAVAGGRQTNVGSGTNPVTVYRILDQSENDVTAFFTNIKTTDGTLEVYQCVFEIILGGTFTYDGNMHYANLTVSGDLSSGQYSVSMAGDGTGQISFSSGDVMNVRVNYGGIEEGLYGGGSNPVTVSFSVGDPSNYSYSVTANPVVITEGTVIVDGG